MLVPGFFIVYITKKRLSDSIYLSRRSGLIYIDLKTIRTHYIHIWLISDQTQRFRMVVKFFSHPENIFFASEFKAFFYLVGWFIYLWQATAPSAAAPPATPATPSCGVRRTPALRTPAAPTPTANPRATGPSAGAARDTRYGISEVYEVWGSEIRQHACQILLR
jgi:hypothetical protein